jgi:hypothetical protein
MEFYNTTSKNWSQLHNKQRPSQWHNNTHENTNTLSTRAALQDLLCTTRSLLNILEEPALLLSAEHYTRLIGVTQQSLPIQQPLTNIKPLFHVDYFALPR